jgi:hypothetical protein
MSPGLLKARLRDPLQISGMTITAVRVRSAPCSPALVDTDRRPIETVHNNALARTGEM